MSNMIELCMVKFISGIRSNILSNFGCPYHLTFQRLNLRRAQLCLEPTKIAAKLVREIWYHYIVPIIL